jgi:hypothetical protein
VPWLAFISVMYFLLKARAALAAQRHLIHLN